jgi:hypothetical protein
MSEKEKRKEKPKRSSRSFIGLSMVMLLVFLFGMSFALYYLLKPEPSILPFEGTSEWIETANSIALTQISASATAEATTHNIARSRATETMEYVQTLYYVRETMTALGDWTWREATATAEAEQGQ